MNPLIQYLITGSVDEYKPITTLYADFSEAEKKGTEAILNLYSTTLKRYKENYKIITELGIVINKKMLELFNTDRESFSAYNNLWKQLHKYIDEHFTETEQRYYSITLEIAL